MSHQNLTPEQAFLAAAAHPEFHEPGFLYFIPHEMKGPRTEFARYLALDPSRSHSYLKPRRSTNWTPSNPPWPVVLFRKEEAPNGFPGFLRQTETPHPRNLKAPVPRGWIFGNAALGDIVLARNPWAPGGWEKTAMFQGLMNYLIKETP